MLNILKSHHITTYLFLICWAFSLISVGYACGISVREEDQNLKENELHVGKG